MNLQSQHIGLPTSKEQLHFFFVNPPASLVKIKSIGIKTATMDSDIVYEVYNYMLLYHIFIIILRMWSFQCLMIIL